ncbi:MAG TPA: ATP-binding cassette domain-containing protein [Panacibacter sp.]|nr:ATP-binding cassette domain-containing protein [Panacibacter sp.]
MNETLFSINNLSCAYSNSKEDKVLQIDKLDIPRGKLVFLLGASGCGKSTLLETLGLMNNTITSGSINFFPDQGSPSVDLARLWDPEKYNILTEVRKKYYSFIFQNTNLMENFTAYENVCLSGMIKENISQEVTLGKAKELMEKIKLPDSEVDLETLAVNLSGGQRQRLAFVRALNNNATVLFGDEPTGNLDEANANELFEIIKSNLHDGISAIVVSHDINLAVKYADEIIVITKDADKNFGEIKDANIFFRESWENAPQNEIELLKDQLRSFYHVANEHKATSEKLKGTVDTRVTYLKLFLQKEGKVLFGKKLVNFWILALILFFTFLAIGFANGSLDYLNKQMNSAFVNWVTIEIPYTRSNEIKKIVADCGMPEIKNEFFIQNLTLYKESAVAIYDYKDNNIYAIKSRSVNLDEDSRLLSEFVLNDKNIVKGRKEGFRNQKDIGLIVTKSFLQHYHYPEDANIIYCANTVNDTTLPGNRREIKVPIQVRTIVNELPGKLDLIYPINFYNVFLTGAGYGFDISSRNNLIELFFKSDDIEKATNLKKKLDSFFITHPEYDEFVPNIDSPQKDTLGFTGGFNFNISFFPALANGALTDSLANKLLLYLNNNNVIRTYSYPDVEDIVKEVSYDQVSVYFKNLDKIRDFANYLFKTYNKNRNDLIELDTNKIKEKENFNFLSNVTKIIAMLLLIFSTVAIGLFISNLLKSHLSKVKMNIGTFKAIGLADSKARGIYFAIIFIFISVATCAALLLASISGLILDNILTRSLSVEQDVSYFRLIDLNTLWALLVILLSAFYISWITIRKMLNKTPGDLIYNR